jgi:hypothetical protein
MLEGDPTGYSAREGLRPFPRQVVPCNLMNEIDE